MLLVPVRMQQWWSDLSGAARGIILMVLTTIGFSTMHVLVRYVSPDMHPFQIAFFRNFLGLIVFLPWIWRAGFSVLRTDRLSVHLLRAGLNVGAMLAYFMALSLTPVAQVTALSFMAPIFAGLLAVLVLGERFRARRWLATMFGFVGALIILRPGLQTIDLGSALALGSSLLWGITVIVIRVLGRTESSATTTIYMSILLSTLSFFPALFVWQTSSLQTFMLLTVIAIIGTISQVGIAQSLREAEAITVMPFDFLKLIWAAILGYLVFVEIPDRFVWIGAVIIFSSSVYLAFRESRVGRPQRPPAPQGPGA